MVTTVVRACEGNCRYHDLLRSYDFSNISTEDIEKLRVLIQKLPPSEQVRCKDSKTGLNFSLRILQAMYYVETGTKFGITPRLGSFSKNDIAMVEIFKRSRLGYIPFPGLELTSPDFPTPTLFSFHDRLHWEVMHIYSPQLVDGLIELLAVTRKINGNIMTHEIWKLSDFLFRGFNSGKKMQQRGLLIFTTQLLDTLMQNYLIGSWYSISMQKVRAGKRDMELI